MASFAASATDIGQHSSMRLRPPHTGTRERPPLLIHPLDGRGRVRARPRGKGWEAEVAADPRLPYTVSGRRGCCEDTCIAGLPNAHHHGERARSFVAPNQYSFSEDDRSCAGGVTNAGVENAALCTMPDDARCARGRCGKVLALLRVKNGFLCCLLLGLTSCTHGASLRSRSAGDLHCPAGDLQIYRLDDRSYRVIGCDQEVVYVSTCDAHRNCTWVVNENIVQARARSEQVPQASGTGCSFDAQCKGDRICVDRQCAAPPPSPREP